MKVVTSIVVVGWLVLMAACSEPPASPRAGGSGDGRVDAPPARTGTFARIERPAGGNASGGANSRATDSNAPETIRLPPTGTSGFGGTYQPATGNFGFGGADSPAPKPKFLPSGGSGFPEDHEE